MAKPKRHITFYRLDHKPLHIYKYGMLCTRTWWQCFKYGIKHIRKGNAFFFTIEKSRHC